MKIFDYKKQKGFTLVELIVATAIFVIVFSMIISAFIAITKRQHRLAAFQDLQEEARYVLDKIAKEIRMSEIDPEGEAGDVYVTNSLKILAYKEGAEDPVGVEYKLADDRIVRIVNDSPVGGEQYHYLTSSNLKVTDLKFYVDKKNHPKVTTSVQLASNDNYPSEVEKTIAIQTTILLRTFNYTTRISVDSLNDFLGFFDVEYEDHYGP